MPDRLIDHTTKQPKYWQLIDGILADIERGTLELGQQLPSISELAGRQGVAKVTVAKAYELLRERGVVLARHGKGFYVATTDVHTPLNVLLLFDTLNAYKETLYDALKAALPPDAALSVFFHHYNRDLFASLIRNSIGHYTNYVIMPHFADDVSEVVRRIPPDKLLLIDQMIDGLPGDYSAVYQDFEQTVYNALTLISDRLRHYRRLTLVRATNQFQYIPATLLAGYQRFGRDSGIVCAVIDNYDDALVQPGEAFLLFAERDLIALLKQVNRAGLTLGQDVGVMAYDDTPVKEILAGGITVISTDFGQMGRTAGELLTTRKRARIANPGGLIRRQSL